MRRALPVLTLAFGLIGCGEGDPSGEQVAKSWAAAVDAEDWPAACDLMLRPDDACRQDLADNFARKDVRLLPAGGYNNGGEVTDNETRFAVTTDKDDAAYFEIVGSKVDLQIVTSTYGGA